jgi:hypothetical protein
MIPAPLTSFNVILNRSIMDCDCVVTFEDYQKYTGTLYGCKMVNACDFDMGVTVVFGMRGEVGAYYLEWAE